MSPHSDNFHQVWSWYDSRLPNYNVVAADTLLNFVTLTFDLLTMDSGRTWRVIVIYRSTKMENPTPIPSKLWVMTSTIGRHWQCVCSNCACAVSHNLCVGCKFSPHTWNPDKRFIFSLCNFYGYTIKINWYILHSVRPCVNATAMSAHAPNHVGQNNHTFRIIWLIFVYQ